MNKNDLILAFSNVCDYVAGNIHALSLPNLNNDQEMITILLEDAHIEDIQDWWDIDNHLAKWIVYLDKLETEEHGSRQDNIDQGVEELGWYPHLIEELANIHALSHAEGVEVLKYIPHVAEYSKVLKEADGYKKLDERCKQMENVVAWPMVTVGGEPKNLKSAFYLNVAVLSSDNKPLKPKIQQLGKFTF